MVKSARDAVLAEEALAEEDIVVEKEKEKEKEKEPSKTNKTKTTSTTRISPIVSLVVYSKHPNKIIFVFSTHMIFYIFATRNSVRRNISSRDHVDVKLSCIDFCTIAYNSFKAESRNVGVTK